MTLEFGQNVRLCSDFQCGNNEFSCDSGNCINLPNRCNRLADCRDASDEAGCNYVDIDEKQYRKVDPPIKKDAKTFITIGE